MTKKFRYIFLLAALTLISCERIAEIEPATKACAPMPEGGRAAACACALDGKAYVFGGRDEKGRYLRDLWEYDPVTDSWNNLGDCPMTARVNATMAAMDGLLYMGLGYSAKHAYQDSCYQRDWWSYNPKTAQWTRLADYPSQNTVAATTATEGDNILVYYGCGHVQQNEVYRYDISANTWQKWASTGNTAPRAFGCAGAAIGSYLYFGTGFNSNNLTNWYKASLVDNTWQRVRSLPGKGREFAACAATDKYVYIFGGRYFGGDMTGGEIFNTYMRYSPDKDQWEWCDTMPCGRAENQIAVTISGKVYFGLGENENAQIINTLYTIE